MCCLLIKALFSALEQHTSVKVIFANFFPTSTEHANRNNSTANMKLNISYPANGSQKLIEIEDERKLRVFMDKYDILLNGSCFLAIFAALRSRISRKSTNICSGAWVLKFQETVLVTSSRVTSSELLEETTNRVSYVWTVGRNTRAFC